MLQMEPVFAVPGESSDFVCLDNIRSFYRAGSSWRAHSAGRSLVQERRTVAFLCTPLENSEPQQQLLMCLFLRLLIDKAVRGSSCPGQTHLKTT